MANPILPIQAGATLPSQEHEDEIQQMEMNERDVAKLEEALGLESQDVDMEQEVIELDDGSVVVNFKPKDGPLKNPDFYVNLAEELDEDDLDELAQNYLDLIDVDKEARKERDKQYEDGLRRTGLGKDAPGGATFDGASKVVHPVMAEACVDFAASASRELLPPDGIVKSRIQGEIDRVREAISERKTNFMNWQLDTQIPEYRDEMHILLTQTPLGGSQYLKWRYDNEQKRPTCEWVPIDNMLLPYSATSFYTAQRVTEVQDITEDILKQRIDQGIYRDIEDYHVSDTALDDQTQSKKANDKIEGASRPGKNVDGIRRVYEITCFERLEADDLTDGKRAPYILTIDDTTGKVLSLYRNWESGDEKLTKLDWIVEFKFIPWRGAYAIGLPHLIGGLSAALTGALRALLDAAHINNSQTMLKLKGGRINGQNDRIEPTQVVEIEGAPGVDDVRKLAMPLPFNQPSSTLFSLLGWLTDAAKGVVTTAEEKIGDVNSNTPVGTTQALIEQGSKVFSSIHARLHRSQSKSLEILSRINHWYVEEMDNQSGEEIEVRDFAHNTDVEPVSDPNIFSETQRLAQAQAVLQLANSAPQLYDMRAAHRRVLKQLKVPNIEEILPNPDGIKEANPALENVSMSMGRHAAAYPDQDHLSHLKTHLLFVTDPMLGGNPLIGPQITPLMMEHVKQHFTLYYLQSMRSYVSQAAGGKDVFKLHEERPLDQEAQQALALAAELVAGDTQEKLGGAMPIITQMVQKLQQAKQAQQQEAANADPTAQVILKTQTAETQRKAQEFQSKMQAEMQAQQQDFQVKVAELQAKVQELSVKYDTQTKVDANKNATQIALANINNAADERIASINHGAAFDQMQAQLEHEQNMSAIDAINAADQDIRQHGLTVEQQAFQQQAQQTQAQIEAQHQQALQDQQHQQTLQQQGQEHQQGIQQAGLEHAQGMQQQDQAHTQGLQQQDLDAQAKMMQQDMDHMNTLQQQAAQPQPPTGG